MQKIHPSIDIPRGTRDTGSGETPKNQERHRPHGVPGGSLSRLESRGDPPSHRRHILSTAALILRARDPSAKLLVAAQRHVHVDARALVAPPISSLRPRNNTPRSAFPRRLPATLFKFLERARRASNIMYLNMPDSARGPARYPSFPMSPSSRDARSGPPRRPRPGRWVTRAEGASIAFVRSSWPP